MNIVTSTNAVELTFQRPEYECVDCTAKTLIGPIWVADPNGAYTEHGPYCSDCLRARLVAYPEKKP